jgi:uncharacterized protein YndB with AHSA1/START domain
MSISRAEGFHRRRLVSIFVQPVRRASEGAHAAPALATKENGMNKTLHFPIWIEAPREKVWSTMLEPRTYEQWTAPFCEGSRFEGGWEQGDRIRFLAPSGEGMVSEIAQSRRGEFVSIRHLGEMQGGVEDTTSEKVRAWAPAYENYTFTASRGGTQLQVDVDVLPDYEQFMQDTFPKALARLKELCEGAAA